MLTEKPIEGRPETGALQVNDDWPGVFIRGDNAIMGYAPALEALLEGRASAIDTMMCQSLLRLLMSPHAASDGGGQVVRTQS